MRKAELQISGFEISEEGGLTSYSDNDRVGAWRLTSHFAGSILWGCIDGDTLRSVDPILRKCYESGAFEGLRMFLRNEPKLFGEKNKS
jgi:hypothetical protein